MCIRDRYMGHTIKKFGGKMDTTMEEEPNVIWQRALEEKGKEGVGLDSFLMLKVLGKGSYAKVVLVKKKDSGELFAMKVLRKDTAEKRRQVEHIKTERNVLVGASHPFIIRLAYAFQNERKLFFVMEYCPGGELFYLLQKKKMFNEEQVKFYAGQIALALQHLHENNIIYRDLKPENVLIDTQGYIRITDFGLSKEGVYGSNKGANTICGTPEYLAPEMLLKKGHGKAVDWWTFGAIVYEMVTGLPPFYTSNREELFRRIVHEALPIPKYLSENLKSLFHGVFQKNPEKRLGSGPDGALEIVKHPWFSTLDWDALYRKEIRPPFVPKLKNELDVSNFDPEFTETPVESCKEGGSFTQDHFRTYENFSWNGDLETDMFTRQDNQAKL
eukprot:TRINITY_DN10054_c0_g10_i2.p1 TRINITY_DN10054_c0_g10~~TRINITY_DN10054_c0_g10_i2.p1  ORF type:complete len:386 (+),score=80.88 TRINITY_DN10054_c0_g10_i2:65-1222(+)